MFFHEVNINSSIPVIYTELKYMQYDIGSGLTEYSYKIKNTCYNDGKLLVRKHHMKDRTMPTVQP